MGHYCYALVNQGMREFAKASSEGKLHGIAEEPGQGTQLLKINDRWNATITYGVPQFWFQGEPPGNPEPIGSGLPGGSPTNQNCGTP